MANFSGDADDVDQPDGAGDVTVLHGSGRKQRGGVHRSRSRKKRRESIFDVLVNEKEMMRSSTDLVVRVAFLGEIVHTATHFFAWI